MVSRVGEVSEKPLRTTSLARALCEGERWDMSGGGNVQWRITDFTDVTDVSTRWHVVVALLGNPGRESRRLSRLLERLPAERHRHLIADDVRRRLWPAQAVDSAAASGSYGAVDRAGALTPGRALVAAQPVKSTLWNR